MPRKDGSKPPKGHQRSPKEQALDDLVMATNSSSIVSKRSVERIYYPDEPHFFRFFVKKFQRRAPLINRGYYIRLHVIDVAVRRFLDRPSDKKKVIINLGCGSDVLPWQCMTRYPNQCQNVKFVDIDFPDLIEKKCRVVQETPELNFPLTGLKTNVVNHVQLQSDQYIEIGCDLRRISDIEQALSTVLDVADCEFMFVAEVSITYMETEAADAVIKWASTLGQADFCLLEQIIPDGEDHPFAQTMLAHFEKLKTPLKSVFAYPTLDSQRDRFINRGWSKVDVKSLWHIWCDDQWLPAEERRKIDTIELEPFDEWEEFALFAGHYCVVIAETNPANITTVPNGSENVIEPQFITQPLSAKFCEYSGTRGQRRFGAALKLKNDLGEEYLANTFGSGTNTRLRSYDVYERGSPLQDITTHHAGPSSRMCHTITDLGDHRSLLVGGRSSPLSPLRDCWLFDKTDNTWQRTADLPTPIYRHSTSRLAHSRMVLLIGGKSGPSTIFDGCLIYTPNSGWVECEILKSGYTPVFGALLASLPEARSSVSGDGFQFNGVLTGGISHDGIVASQILLWDLVFPGAGKPTISFKPLSEARNFGPWDRSVSSINHPDALLNRFGATGFISSQGHFTTIGGIIADGIATQDNDVVVVDIFDPHYQVLSVFRIEAVPRPLLIGVSTEITSNGTLLIMGGGATCFSMGTFWNRGCYTSTYNYATVGHTQRPSDGRNVWRYSKIVELTDEVKRQDVPFSGNGQVASKVDIPRVQVNTKPEFFDVLKVGKPVIMEGGDLGGCVRKWSSEYIVQQLGFDRKVVVHEANTAKMDFNSKNFSYVTKSFGNTMEEIEKGHKLYLRALSEDHPTDQPANIKLDFPQLADNFQLPDALSFVKENEFSSVLRITGPVNMWLHYDVMANVYCQIVGTKRFILFPPSDVTRLSFAAGSSSSSIDVFSELESSSLAGTHPHEAVLKPGDIMFLPPLWLHTATPLSNLGVAVNVFFRNLENGYSSGRDVYGNRDLAAYEKGRLDVARIANSFNKLPLDVREFYIKRLADELAQKAVE
ncbi:LCM-domain-containing protein [Rostrohypoxylon terebratum]|nr:LCM-domain-containing protein [Rostrohypoxylon terebratum]